MFIIYFIFIISVCFYRHRHTHTQYIDRQTDTKVTLPSCPLRDIADVGISLLLSSELLVLRGPLRVSHGAGNQETGSGSFVSSIVQLHCINVQLGSREIGTWSKLCVL